MKQFLVALLVFVSLLAQAQQSGQMSIDGMKPLKNTLLPFQSDGCTGWIDSFVGKDYTSCCLDHDIRYWIGGTKKEKLETDLALRKCVNKIAGHPMGELMFVFVWMWGKLDSTDVTRWANGWKFLRQKYQPVTVEERAMAAQMTPPSLASAARKYWSKEVKATTKIETYQAEPFPTVLGNYCLDEVASKLARTAVELGKPNLELKYKPDENFKTSYRIRTNLCDEDIVAHFQVTQLSMCEEAVWGIEPSHYLRGMVSYGSCEKLLKSLSKQKSE